MSELTKPFQAMANLTGMKFLPTYTVQGVRTLTSEQLQERAEELVRAVTK
jgi:glutathione-regulated potassium-efflux system ancillary protein KefG